MLIFLTSKFHVKPHYLRKFFFYILIPEITKSIHVKIIKNETFRIYTRRDSVSYHYFWYNLNFLDYTLIIFYKLAKNSRIIIDIGANTGIFSLIAGNINKNSKVYAFEPVYKIYERLRENIELNRLNNIIAENLAISNINERVIISIPNNIYSLPTESSLNQNFLNSNDKFEKLVSATSLDSYLKKKDTSIKEVDLIKIDIEGEELKAFEGMTEVLNNQNPFIICEVLPDRTEKKLESFLSLFNYKYFLITDLGLKQKKKIIGNGRFFNYLFYKGNIETLQKIIAPIKIY